MAPEQNNLQQNSPSEPVTKINPVPESPAPLATPSQKSKKSLLIVVAILILLVIMAASFWLLGKSSSNQSVTKTTTTTSSDTASETNAPATKTEVKGLQLDTNKNYGNKYSNGLLPVGDSKYSASAAKVGSVYACSQYAQNFGRDQGGAGSRGPWFTSNNTQYDVNKKAHIQGSVTWQADFSMKTVGDIRTIITNGLPSHPTGTFPVSRSDPAYAYDRNPNMIKGQTLTYSLSTSPSYGEPQCMGGEVGVMLTGIPLFNAFDAGGRDAGAWEVQDSCSGHPQKEGEYHYHTLSSCITDISVKTVIGFALDGFPITGPQVSKDNILTTTDLDECHGLTSDLNLEGKIVTMYHYVMTQDFPYSVSCFRSKPANPPNQPQR